jgi:NDP-sugar pyrophosphorylase family protein
MVLAAGLGHRLRPLTAYWAKPAIPVLGRPLVQYSLRLLERAGVTEVAVNLHHRPETVTSALADGAFGGLNVHFSREPELLGTAGGLKKVESFLGGETFLLLNGDTLIDCDLRAMVEWHRRRKARATLLLRPREEGSDYTAIGVERRGRITSLGGPAKPGKSALMFAGVWVLEPEVLELIVPDRFSRLEVDVLPRLVAERAAFGYVQNLPWFDLGDPRRYLNACLTVLRRGYFRDLWQATPVASASSLVDEARVVAGPGSTVDPDARFSGEVILGSGVTVGKGAVLERSILWDGVAVGEGAVVRGAIVASGVSLAPRSRTLGKVVVKLDRLDQDRGLFRTREIVAGHVVATLGD